MIEHIGNSEGGGQGRTLLLQNLYSFMSMYTEILIYDQTIHNN